MLRFRLIALIILSMPTFVLAQVGVGTSNPATSAQLEVNSTTKGFLPPRMTSTQRNAISSPAQGLMVYQTDATAGLYYYTGSAWIYIINATSDVLPVANGGTGATSAGDARANLGATTVGSNLFTLTNPSAISFPRINADNTVSALDASTFRSAIGAGTSSTVGTVTSVALSAGTSGTDVSVNGSPVTSSGTLTLNIPTASATNRGALSSTDWTTFNNKESAITAGTNTQYYRGDKTFQTLNTTAVTEGTNLYYTDARARGAISLTTSGSSGASTYSSGTLNIPTYTFNGLSPMTTLGDIIYGGASGAATRLAGNTTTTKKFLSQTGDGTNSAAPSWSAITASDIPTLNQNSTGSAGSVTNAVTFNTSGGAAAGTSYNGSTARTIDYSSVGASPLAGSSSITTVGTITSGTWSGTTIGVAYGGTGATTLTSNGVLIGNGTSAISATTAGSADQVLRVPSAGGSPAFGSIDISKSAAVTGTLSVTNGGTGVTTSTGSGSNVLSTSPALTTPAIGSGGFTIAGSTSGTTTLVTSAVASGTITIPAGTATLATTSNKLSAFASTSSSELAGAISDETGSGSLVFGTSPTFTTPTLGAATATSINKVIITAPTNNATLTIADGKTLTASNSITLSGTDATSMTFPSSNATIARTDAAQTFTGIQTFGDIIANSVSGSSDQRFKINIKQIENPIEKIKLIRGVTFNWNQKEYPEKNFGDQREIGFIAQEIEKIIPEVVVKEVSTEEYRSVKYDKIVALLLEGIKEQQRQIDLLKSELLILKKERKNK